MSTVNAKTKMPITCDIFNDLISNSDEKLKDQVMRTYTELAELIPVNLFVGRGEASQSDNRNNSETSNEESSYNPRDAAYIQFESNPVLRSLSSRTKRLIIMDVSKTFDEFCSKSVSISSYLSESQRYDAVLLVLCRILCSVCTIFSIEYKQGMNHAAGAVLLNSLMRPRKSQTPSTGSFFGLAQVVTACVTDNSVHDLAHYISFEQEIKSCLAVCLMLSSDSLLPLLKGSGQLFAQVKRLEYVLTRYGGTTQVVGHLESNGTSLDSLTQQWLVTCFSVGVPHELTLAVQEMLIRNIQADVFIRIGVAIVALLQDKILMLSGQFSCFYTGV